VGVGVADGVAGGSLSAGVSDGSGVGGPADGAVEAGGSGDVGGIVPLSGERGVSVPPLPMLEQATVNSAMSAMDEISRRAGIGMPPGDGFDAVNDRLPR
jgi:hypothetical protein